MMSYSVQSRDWIFVKSYGFLSIAKYMGKNIGINISKRLSGKKFLDHDKHSTTDALKTTLKRATLKTVEATDDLIGNNIADTITKVLKTSLQTNSETVTNKHDKEKPKDEYISLE